MSACQRPGAFEMGLVCKRCILPAGYKSITFDRQGVCNYCNYYDRVRRSAGVLTAQRGCLDLKLRTIPPSSQYHCLVGLSGGRDSTYVLYRLRNEYGLNVLAVTFDNGFLTDYARDNIERVVEKLGVDHFYVDGNWDVLKGAYRRVMVRFAYPCMVCSFAMLGQLLKVGIEYHIPLAVHGVTRAQMFKEFHPASRDPRLPFLELNRRPYSAENSRYAWKQACGQMEYLIRYGLGSSKWRSRFMAFFFGPRQGLDQAPIVPEFYGLFLWEPRDEAEMIRTLSRETGWRRPGGDNPMAHYDCRIYPAAEYLSMAVSGYSLTCPELSFLVREGLLSRDKALSLLPEKGEVFMSAQESLYLLCSRLNIDRKSLSRILLKARIRQKLARLILRTGRHRRSKAFKD